MPQKQKYTAGRKVFFRTSSFWREKQGQNGE